MHISECSSAVIVQPIAGLIALLYFPTDGKDGRRLFMLVQVMDPKKTTNEKVKKDHKPDHTLISFFGDDSYGWFPKGRDIIPFEKNYDAKSKQPASKKVQHSLLCSFSIPMLSAPLFPECKKMYRATNSIAYSRPCISHSQGQLSQSSCLQGMQLTFKIAATSMTDV